MKIFFTQKIVMVFAIFLFPSFLIAQSPSLSLNVEEAGTLEQLLGGDISTVETLILSGVLNDADITTMINMSENNVLKHIDISKITIADELVVFFDAPIISIILPENMVSIETYAFMYSQSLTTVTLPDGLKTIGGSAFSYCGALQTIDFPAGLETIGDRAFDSCLGLTSVTLPASLGAIASYGIFSSCSGIQSVVLEEGITDTGNNMFWSCDQLASVSLPNSLTVIGGQTFYGCNSLLSITIPENVAEIGTYAFMSTYNLRDVYSKNPLPPVAEMTFHYDTMEFGTLYVPAGSATLYKEATEWMNFQQIQEDIPTSIEDEQIGEATTVAGGQGEVIVSIDKTAHTEIYTLAGIRIFGSRLNEGTHRLPLKVGVYIVKINNTANSVLVQ